MALGGAAYILAPQTPGFWLEYDEKGNWADNPGVPSIYTRALKELIDAFVAENPRIDADRILIGGCSNGGYMAVNMALQYPDYFAAAYPICEAYMDSGITDEQLAAVKDLPLWFVYAENDTTVAPGVYEAPTIARLKALGANVKTSVFADVHDTTGLYQQEDGTPYQYNGHWSWTYFFKNECLDDATGENLWAWLGEQSR
jgi:predicted peptidase